MITRLGWGVIPENSKIALLYSSTSDFVHRSAASLLVAYLE